jgi:hypothetical protein
MRCTILVVLAVGIGNIWLVTGGQAQGPADERERRRQAIEGILRSLVETHLSRDRDREPPRPPQQPVPVPPRHRPEDITKYRDAQRAVQEFSNEAGQLIGVLREEEHLSPGIRPLLGDAISIKARSDALLRRPYGPGGADALARDYQEVDRQWRVLSHRLEQADDVSGRCRDHVKKMHAAMRRPLP